MVTRWIQSLYPSLLNSPAGAGATANGEAGGGRKRMVDEFEQVSASIEGVAQLLSV